MTRPLYMFRPNLQNEDHRKAWEILQSVPEGQKSAFLVRAILATEQQRELEATLRRVLREELKAVPCPLKSAWLKSAISSARPSTVLPKSRKRMKTTASEPDVVFSQPVTGFASIAFGYPNASWGEPQTPGIQSPIEYRKRGSAKNFALRF